MRHAFAPLTTAAVSPYVPVVFREEPGGGRESHRRHASRSPASGGRADVGGLVSVGRWFREKRRELGWSLAGVVQRLEDLGVRISTSQLQRIEQGQVPRADQLAALCRVYGLPDGQVLDLFLVLGDRRVRLEPEGKPPELVARGDELLAAGRYDRARARYAAALTLLPLEETLDRARVRLRLAWLDGRQGFAESAFQRAVRLAEDPELPEEIRAPARTILLRSMVSLGWLEMAGHLAPAIEALAGRRGVPAPTRAAALAGIASWHRARGELDRAIEVQQRAVAFLGRAGLEREKLRATLDLIDMLTRKDDTRAALVRARALERATRRADFRGLRPEALLRLGSLLVRVERAEEAVRVLEEAEDAARDLGRDATVFRARAWRLRALRALGRGRAAATLEKWLARRAARYADTPEVRELLSEPGGPEAGETAVPPPEGESTSAPLRRGGEA